MVPAGWIGMFGETVTIEDLLVEQFVDTSSSSFPVYSHPIEYEFSISIHK
jgi:hypothetical protein